MPRPTVDYAEGKRKKAYGLSGYSFYLVFLSFILDFAAIQTGEVVLLLVGGIALTAAWWMAMQSVKKLSKMIEKQNLAKL